MTLVLYRSDCLIVRIIVFGSNKSLITCSANSSFSNTVSKTGCSDFCSVSGCDSNVPVIAI